MSDGTPLPQDEDGMDRLLRETAERLAATSGQGADAAGDAINAASPDPATMPATMPAVNAPGAPPKSSIDVRADLETGHVIVTLTAENIGWAFTPEIARSIAMALRSEANAAERGKRARDEVEKAARAGRRNGGAPWRDRTGRRRW